MNAVATMAASAAGVRATLVDITADGHLVAQLPDGREQVCDWLETLAGAHECLLLGDTLLLLEVGAGWVALGRIGRYRAPSPSPTLAMCATESLTLACGDASLTLKSNGQVLLKGEDVTVRAKGTQRIRAGNVAIN